MIEIDSVEEVDLILKEIVFFTICGLKETGAEHKQFYLERILLTLGLSLELARNKFDLEKGEIAPDFDDVIRAVESMKP